MLVHKYGMYHFITFKFFILTVAVNWYCLLFRWSLYEGCFFCWYLWLGFGKFILPQGHDGSLTIRFVKPFLVKWVVRLGFLALLWFGLNFFHCLYRRPKRTLHRSWYHRPTATLWFGPECFFTKGPTRHCYRYNFIFFTFNIQGPRRHLDFTLSQAPDGTWI